MAVHLHNSSGALATQTHAAAALTTSAVLSSTNDQADTMAATSSNSLATQSTFGGNTNATSTLSPDQQRSSDSSQLSQQQQIFVTATENDGLNRWIASFLAFPPELRIQALMAIVEASSPNEKAELLALVLERIAATSNSPQPAATSIAEQPVQTQDTAGYGTAATTATFNTANTITNTVGRRCIKKCSCHTSKSACHTFAASANVRWRNAAAFTYKRPKADTNSTHHR